MLQKKHFATAAVVVVILTTLLTQSIAAKDKWIRVESKNFNLIGNGSERDIKKVATKLEQFRETFKRLFSSANLDSAIPTNVVVFKSSGSYRNFKPRRADGKADENIAGYFQPGKDVNYITLSTEGEDSQIFGTIFHEYVHFIMNMNYGKSDIPAWLNEGIAEYYQTFEIERDQVVKLGTFQPEHLYLLSSSKMMPLEQLFGITNYSLHRNGNHSRSIFYAQSWALIHYLVHGPKADGLDKFINKLRQNVPAQKAFEESFSMTYADMEKELKKYVNQNSYKLNILTLKEKMSFELDMKSTPLSEAQSNTYLADLLLRTRRYDDAEPFLTSALALEPNSSFTNTTMGMVKLRQRKFDEAKTYLETAVNQDAKNAYAFYNYAYLLSREGRDEFGYVQRFSEAQVQKMREALNKSIALNPAYIESYELLAFVNMVNNEQLAESVELLRTALKHQPGEPGIVLRIAEIWSRMDKFDDAKALAQRMAEVSDDDDVKSRADSLISQISSRANIKAENEARRKEFEVRQKEYEERQKERASGNAGRTSTGPPAIRRRQPEIRRSPEEIAKIAEMQKWISINQAINKPKDGEKQIIGRITKIACPPKQVIYSVKTETGAVSLMSKDFQSLTLVAFDSDAGNVAIGCNRGFTEYNAVLTYKESVAKSTHLGELVSIDFVPADFKFVKEEDLAALESAPSTMAPEIEEVLTVEAPPRSASGEVRVVQAPVNREAERRQMIYESMRENLNKPQTGEIRVMGTFERAECDKNSMYFHIKTPTGILKLKPVKELKLMIYVPDLGGLQLECNEGSIAEPVVLVYKPNTDKKPKFAGDLISMEFVPKGFTLE